MSDEITKLPAASNNSLPPVLNYVSIKTRVKFYGSCLKQDYIKNYIYSWKYSEYSIVAGI